MFICTLCDPGLLIYLEAILESFFFFIDVLKFLDDISKWGLLGEVGIAHLFFWELIGISQSSIFLQPKGISHNLKISFYHFLCLIFMGLICWPLALYISFLFTDNFHFYFALYSLKFPQVLLLFLFYKITILFLSILSCSLMEWLPVDMGFLVWSDEVF